MHACAYSCIHEHDAILSQPPCRVARPCKATCPAVHARARIGVLSCASPCCEERGVRVRRAYARAGVVVAAAPLACTDATRVVRAFARKSIPFEGTDGRRGRGRRDGSKKPRAREFALSKGPSSRAESGRLVTTGIVVMGGVIVATRSLLPADEKFVKD